MNNFRGDIDELTGALNKKALLTRLSELLQEGKEFILLCADIDNMKHFNMHNGHYSGDELLKNFVTLANKLLKNKYAVYRYSGNVFAIIFADLKQGEVLEVAKLIAYIARNEISPQQPAHCGDEHCMGPANISVSIGIAVSKNGNEAEELLEKTERKLYKAKIDGKDKICI